MCASGREEDVRRHEEALLLGRHEARRSPFRCQVPRVSTSESRPPSPGRSPTTT
jgi:hypothetical protein